MTITRSETKLNAIRSARLSFHLHHIYDRCSPASSSINSHVSQTPQLRTQLLTTQLQFVCVRFDLTQSEPEDRLGNSSACRYAHDKKDQADHQEQKEHQLGNPCRRGSNTRESKKRRDQC